MHLLYCLFGLQVSFREKLIGKTDNLFFYTDWLHISMG